MKKIQAFFSKDTNWQRDTYIWNMIGSFLKAFQSVILLMILTRTLGLEDAGIFTIAYASANLFLTIGKYGMRQFQVSDVRKQFSFTEYRYSRYVSVTAMTLVSIAYVLYASVQNDYTAEKAWVILWMCLFKVVDALEDVYHGHYQRENRLIVGAKSMALRLGITIIFFGLMVVVLGNLLFALIVSTIFTTLLYLFFKRCTNAGFETKRENWSIEGVFSLLKLCFPLFIGGFLSFYIGNAPKYAIDALLNDELQACYGFIAMPVFVVGLLNGFIYNPMMFKVSKLWNEGKTKEFLFWTFRQSVIVALITLVCIVGAYLLGVPVLSWLYSTDLSSFKMELLILLLGGGFLGLSGLLQVVIIIIRSQRLLLGGYVIVAVLALILSKPIVSIYGIFGASVLYTMLMGMLCVLFVLIFLSSVHNVRKQQKESTNI